MTTQPRVCHPWASRQWPASALEEQHLVTELTFASRHQSGKVEWSRVDVTMVLTILRSGATLPQVLEQAPGFNLAGALAAYNHLTKELMQASLAWQAIVEDPSPRVIQAQAAEASRILPTPVGQLTQIIGERPDQLATVHGRVVAEVLATSEDAAAIHEQLCRMDPLSQEAVALGLQLFRGGREALWSNPYFRPSRVGELSPLRAASLLGEYVHRGEN